MNRLYTLRYISVVHAIKCNKSDSPEEAGTSFAKLIELKNNVLNASESEFAFVNQNAINWADEHPIATDREIKELINQK